MNNEYTDSPPTQTVQQAAAEAQERYPWGSYSVGFEAGAAWAMERVKAELQRDLGFVCYNTSDEKAKFVEGARLIERRITALYASITGKDKP